MDEAISLVSLNAEPDDVIDDAPASAFSMVYCEDAFFG
jgi:hypothetical protein